MSTCKQCGDRILGDWPNVANLTDRPPSSNCTGCGTPFPWRAAALARAKNIAAMQAEIHALDEATTTELESFTTAVAEQRATAEEAATFGTWFKKKAGPEAAKAVGSVLKELATNTISDIIRKTMLGG